MNSLLKPPTHSTSEFGLFLLTPHKEVPENVPFPQALNRESSGTSLSFSSQEYGVFISDEGILYPPALQKWQIALSHFLMIQTKNAHQAWKAALEAVQTGVFRWVFLRPSQPCETAQLRKLQIESEKQKTSVFLFSKSKLPHWFFKKRTPYSSLLEVCHDIGFITDNLILSKSGTFGSDC